MSFWRGIRLRVDIDSYGCMRRMMLMMYLLEATTYCGYNSSGMGFFGHAMSHAGRKAVDSLLEAKLCDDSEEPKYKC